MCILSATVNKVANTNIFTCAYDDNARQFMVYSNVVDTHVQNNTMILPVPNPHSVEFVNLSKYPSFFDDCAASFSKIPERSMHLYASRSVASASYEAPLPVFNVGSYKVSVVPHITQFARLDPAHFSIDVDVPNTLHKLYDDTFGYLICKLREGNHKYHPFAYTHYIHDNRKLFVPTYHYHSHEYGYANHNDADWDHNIYSVTTDLEQSSNYIFRGNKLQFDKLPRFLEWIKEYKMIKLVRQGSHYPNKDMWLMMLNTRPNNISHSPEVRPRSDIERSSYDFSYFDAKGLARLRKHFGADK